MLEVIDFKKIKDEENKLKNRMSELLNTRSNVVSQIDELKEQIKKIEVDKDMIDSELKNILISTGKNEEPFYSNGFRLAFTQEIVGKIKIGKELELIEWCEKSGYNDLVNIRIGKRSLNKMLDKGVKLPNSLEVDSYNQFKITKDMRKN